MTSLLTRIVAGVAAGAVGTLAMDLVWYRRYRQGGGDQGFVEWEFSASTNSFEDASAPGQAGEWVTGAVGVRLPDQRASETANVVHWLTGVGYGVAHALLQDGRGVVAGGLTTGTGAFANSYATLGAMGIYDPIWEYDVETLWDDLSAHLVFGFAAALTHRALTSSDVG